jgi:hypothetical protein
MKSDAAATVELVDQRSATFLVLKQVSGLVPEPGAYAGEVEVDGVQAGCRITVLDADPGGELWCQPRRPLPRLYARNEATLRFGCTEGQARR